MKWGGSIFNSDIIYIKVRKNKVAAVELLKIFLLWVGAQLVKVNTFPNSYTNFYANVQCTVHSD